MKHILSFQDFLQTLLFYLLNIVYVLQALF